MLVSWNYRYRSGRYSLVGKTFFDDLLKFYCTQQYWRVIFCWMLILLIHIISIMLEKSILSTWYRIGYKYHWYCNFINSEHYRLHTARLPSARNNSPNRWRERVLYALIDLYNIRIYQERRDRVKWCSFTGKWHHFFTKKLINVVTVGTHRLLSSITNEVKE